MILFPYLGPLFYFVFGTDRLVRQKLRATRAMDATGAREERKITGHTEALVERLPDAEQPIVDLLSKLNEFAVSAGESTRLLIDGDQFFPALAERIDQARHHVHIEFYIWRDDARGREMLEHLASAARRGVEVRLLLDRVGCFRLWRSHFAPLVAAGGKFTWFRTAHPFRNRWTFTLRNHRKVQIIDGESCFVGGKKMDREYAGKDPAVGPWRDVQIELIGVAVRKFQMIFADDWFFATEEKRLDRRYYPIPTNPQRLVVQPMTDGPDNADDPIHMSTFLMLNNAPARLVSRGLFRSEGAAPHRAPARRRGGGCAPAHFRKDRSPGARECSPILL